ncbi:hypothetical protein Tco_0928878, partial [Tanacetum coccineum]
PDIMFAVYACSRFQVTPKTSHLYVVKRIFRYLKGNPKLGLWYPRVSTFDLEAFSNSDYVGANLDRKSITGGTDIINITRKEQKPGKNGHRNGKSTQELGVSSKKSIKCSPISTSPEPPVAQPRQRRVLCSYGDGATEVLRIQEKVTARRAVYHYDSDFLIEEVDTFLVSEDSIPPGIESDFDSEGDIIFLNDLLNDDPIPEYERFTFDIEPDAPVINNFDELNEDECFDPGGGEIVFSPNVEDDDSFTF